jgi:uncharacterized damage-inducible protein DinB
VDVTGLLNELLDRVTGHVADLVADLDEAAMLTPPADGANPIGWLVWHLTRVEDHHVAELLDQPQVWVEGNWGPRFGLPSDPDDSGYGHSPEEVTTVRPERPRVLADYHAAVQERTRAYIDGLTPADLDRIVDRRWDPPVTLGVRLVSIIDDQMQHCGQAAYVRGLQHRA